MHQAIVRCLGFVQDESGQDLIEYGLLAAVISLSAVAITMALGESINGMYAEIPDELP